ncbi:hypothetical protein CYMTET_52216 [Cymbomonas tetramitiformis]|uniref:Cyclic nucleotide-binding domain-containing protein n=1 Tax=Cymbomonas tetramitiformis TaxID=36881 RepID=A0AAE0ESZ1_9CHLO|nr:hypothetical protein CYMTET_52216 [Cymbomonas tetramitiformis]
MGASIKGASIGAGAAARVQHSEGQRKALTFERDQFLMDICSHVCREQLDRDYTVAQYCPPALQQPATHSDWMYGEVGDTMIFFVAGHAEIILSDEEVAQFQPGGFFGELGLLIGMPHAASVEARAGSVVCRLNRTDMMQCLTLYPLFGRSFTKAVQYAPYSPHPQASSPAPSFNS